jgi:uncharacterized membrane protein YraQ (UPF0718 family)
MMGNIFEKVGFGGIFFLLVLIAYWILGIYDFSLLKNALTALAGLSVRIAPILLLIFLIMFLTNLFFGSDRVLRLLGKGSGVRGWALAIGGGIVSSGPIYMWYPLLGDLKEKGMKDSLVAAFLYNRAVKIPLLPIMVHYFGWPFAVVLSAYMISFSVINGIAVQTFTREGPKR